MNTILKTTAAILFAGFAIGVSFADEKKEDHDGHDHDHDHDHAEKIAGPNGGRVFTSVEPHLEFLFLEDRKVRITALNEENKPIAIADQNVRVTGGDRTNPTRLAFAKDGDVLVSDGAFPAGNDFPVVVQIKPTPDSKSVLEKFNLNLVKCPTCPYLEYACTCCHGHDHDHDHKEEGEKKE